MQWGSSYAFKCMHFMHSKHCRHFILLVTWFTLDRHCSRNIVIACHRNCSFKLHRIKITFFFALARIPLCLSHNFKNLCVALLKHHWRRLSLADVVALFLLFMFFFFFAVTRTRAKTRESVALLVSSAKCFSHPLLAAQKSLHKLRVLVAKRNEYHNDLLCAGNSI